MFRTILVGTDGSDTATVALRHAAFLAERLSAELTVASIFDPAHGPRSAGASPEADIAMAILRDAAAILSGSTTVRTRAVRGRPEDVLPAIADEEGFDLLVVGNRGMARTGRLQPGSVPDRISHRSPTHLLLVDTGQHRRPAFRRIVVGTDGSPTATTAVALAVELAGALGAYLTVATVAASDTAGEGVLADVRGRYDVPDLRVLRGDPAEAICSLAEDEDFDLVVVGSKGMSGPRRLLGSVPDRISHRCPTNMLVARTGL